MMMTNEEALKIIQVCFDNLFDSGMIDEKVPVSEETIIIGNGSKLDSISFVTMITDLEEKLSEKSSKDVFFVLNDIQDFNIDNPFVSASIFAQYMQKLVN